MQNSIFAGLVAIVAGANLTSGALAQDRSVNVLNWSDYIDEEVLEQFTAETGIFVIYDVFDKNEVLDAKLLAGGSGYDIVVPSAEFLARQIKAGVFQELDKSKLTNLPNMWGEVSSKLETYDPGGKYSINYMWGTTGIGYNQNKIKEILGQEAPVSSWKLVFEKSNMEKLQKCGVHFLDAPNEMLSIALKYLGFDPQSSEIEELDKAGELLDSVAPFVQKFHSSEYIQALASGDICVAVGFSGDVFQARDAASDSDNGIEIAYSIPQEGTKVWFDQMAIPADAGNVENAHIFLNFFMRPEIIAQVTNYVFYANGNKASQPLLDRELIEDPSIYPTAEVEKRLFSKLPYDRTTQSHVAKLWEHITRDN